MPLADEKQIDLSIEMFSSEGDPLSETDAVGAYWIEGDRIELRRLLTNLLGNAIKFTDTGYISVQLSINPNAEQLPSSEAIEIAIKDTGPGIEEEAQKQIFEWFYQGAHMKAGSGLGLHLSKRIAEMHNGTLTVESAVGKGSTFTLALPLACQN